MTRDELAAMLLTVNVVDVAREAGVSTKTVYRHRRKEHSPNLGTAQALAEAVKRLRRRGKRRSEAQPA
jgi:DNA-binding phage protein